MAVLRCKECGKDVSSKAALCPSCGAPVRRKSGCGGKLLLVLLIFVVGGGVARMMVNSPPRLNESSASSKPTSGSQTIEEIRERLKTLPVTGRPEDAERRATLQKELHRLGGDTPAPEPPAEPVQNSAWDGSVYQVASYLKRTLKDPDSYQGIEWSPVTKTTDGGYMVRHRYRAKNSFGGYVVEEKIFTLDSQGNVTGP